jgi:hypothetical protein
LSKEQEDILRLPKLNDMKGGWDEGISKKSRLIPRQLGRIKLRDKVMTPEVVRVRKGIYIIKDFGDVIRIEKAKYEDIQ